MAVKTRRLNDKRKGWKKWHLLWAQKFVFFRTLIWAKFPEIIPSQPMLWGIFLELGLRILKKFKSPAKLELGRVWARQFSCNFTSRKLRRVTKTGRQQALAFRCHRRGPPDLGYRGECSTYRPLLVLSLRLSIWGGSALRDVAASKTARRRLLQTP